MSYSTVNFAKEILERRNIKSINTMEDISESTGASVPVLCITYTTGSVEYIRGEEKITNFVNEMKS